MFHYFMDIARKVGEPILNGDSVPFADRIKYWMDQGAIPSDTVKSLFKKEGLFAPAS